MMHLFFIVYAVSALVLDIFHDTPSPIDFKNKTSRTTDYDQFFEKIDDSKIVALLHTIFYIFIFVFILFRTQSFFVLH